MAGVYFPQSFPYFPMSHDRPPMRPLPAALLGLDDPSQSKFQADMCRADDSVALSAAARQSLSSQDSNQPSDRPRPEEIADRVGQGADYVDAFKHARHSSTARAAGSGADEAARAVASSSDDIARGASTLSRVGGGALRAAGPIGVAATVATSGIEAHQALTDPNANREQRAERVGAAIGSGAGSLAAGAAGAKVGLAVGAIGGPPGMVVGAIVGGVGGAIAGSSVGRWIGGKAGELFG